MNVTWACRDGTNNHDFDTLTDSCRKCGAEAINTVKTITRFHDPNETAIERQERYYAEQDAKIALQRMKRF